MSKQMNLVDLYNIQSMIDRRCQGMGLSARFDEHAVTAMTSKSEIVLPALRLPMTEDQVNLVYGYVIHETGHHTRPEAFEIIKNAKLQPGSPLHSIFNMVEDEAMEREVSGYYIGDRKALGESMALHIKQQMENNKDALNSTEEWDEESINSTACYLLMLDARADWDHASAVQGDVYRRAVPDKARTLSSELVGKGYVDRLQVPKDPHAAWDLSVDLYKELYPDEDDDKLEELRIQGHEGGGGEVQGDDRCKDGDSTGDGEQGGGRSPPEGVLIPWDQVVHSDHDNDYVGTCGIDWTGYTGVEKLGVAPPNEVNVLKCGETYPGYVSTSDDARAFASNMRRYLQARERTKVHPEQLHGKLNRQSIYKLAFPPIDGGEWNKKIFYTTKHREKMNTCIGVLVDWSGSMDGMKKVYAADAANRMCAVFSRAIKVPTMIAAFSNAQSSCDIGIIKEWNERSLTQQVVGARFKYFDEYTSANNDSDALLWMYNNMLQRKEERKILVVVSDGSPVCAYIGQPHNNLLHVTKYIESNKNFSLMGLGICSQQVAKYYTNHRVIDKPAMINQALLELLKEAYVSA